MALRANRSDAMPARAGRPATARARWLARAAGPDDVVLLDRALTHLADLVADTTGEDHRDDPGAGAAGRGTVIDVAIPVRSIASIEPAGVQRST